MAVGDHAISIYKQQNGKCTRSTTANYKMWITDNTEKDVCYVGRKPAASAFISSGVSLNAAIPRNINPISEPS